MKKFLTALFLLPLLAAAPADAAGIKYFEDPVYQKLAPDDHLPMEDMMMLADDGDVRAMYILGDLFSKGKGGFPKNMTKAREWFETSARNGYAFSFIRLAALEKRERNFVTAYQWYTLAITHCDGDDRKWADKARDKLVEDAKLSEDDIKAAKTGSRQWQEQAIEKNRADKEARRLKEEALVGPKKPRAANEKPIGETKSESTSSTTTTTTYKQYRNGDN